MSETWVDAEDWVPTSEEAGVDVQFLTVPRCQKL
jgi:hypothetical protein